MEFKRKKRESFESFLRRFNKKMQQSGKLFEARQAQHLQPKINKTQQKKRALVEHFSQGASRRYDEGSYNLARFRGITFRGEFCEAFQVWRVETIF